jgi:hypothetical protein
MVHEFIISDMMFNLTVIVVKGSIPPICHNKEQPCQSFHECGSAQLRGSPSTSVNSTTIDNIIFELNWSILLDQRIIIMYIAAQVVVVAVGGGGSSHEHDKCMIDNWVESIF